MSSTSKSMRMFELCKKTCEKKVKDIFRNLKNITIQVKKEQIRKIHCRLCNITVWLKGMKSFYNRKTLGQNRTKN